MTKSMNKADVVGGLIILLFSAAGLYFTKDIQGGPCAFPVVTLSGMAVLALVLIGNALRGATRGGKTLEAFESELAEGIAVDFESEKATEPETEAGPAKQKRRGGGLIVGLFAITAAYLVAMDVIGFVISTPLYIFVLMFVLGMRRYIFMIVTSLVTVTVIFIVFRTLMYLSLPGGIFDPTEFIYRLLE